MVTEILTPQKTVSFEKIETTAYPTGDEACNAVADEIAALIKQRNRNGQSTVLGLATGATPKKVYAALIRHHREKGLSFKNVISFNLDEYFGLQPDALQSYRRFMDENLFSHVDINKENCFIPHGGIPQEMLKLHCEDYERKIEEYGGIDFQLLGIILVLTNPAVMLIPPPGLSHSITSPALMPPMNLAALPTCPVRL
jgi:glucosamine-6-phosphate deaminase